MIRPSNPDSVTCRLQKSMVIGPAAAIWGRFRFWFEVTTRSLVKTAFVPECAKLFTVVQIGAAVELVLPQLAGSEPGATLSKFSEMEVTTCGQATVQSAPDVDTPPA